MTDLVNEVKLGVTKGTGIEEAVEKNYRGECLEIGFYLAAARQAEREGYPEIGQVLEKIAWEEAAHAARFAEMNGMISSSTKENLEKAFAGEQMSNKGKREAALQAKDEGNDQGHDFFDESSRDEARHALALEGMLRRYFKH